MKIPKQEYTAEFTGWKTRNRGKLISMLVKISLAIKFLLAVQFIGRKSGQFKNIVIVNGASAISVSKKLSNESDDFGFFVPIKYIPRVLNAGLVERVIVAPSFAVYVRAVLFAIRDFGCKDFSSFLSFWGSKLVLSYIDKNKKNILNVIVYNERLIIPLSAIAAAKKNKIRTCCIQHGAIVENYFPVGVDVYFTWSDYYSGIINERSPDVLAINVGRLDYSAPPPSISNRSDIPLVALQPGDVSIPYETLLRNFVDIVEVCLDVFDGVVLRRHPKDNVSVALLYFFNNDKRISFDVDSLQDSLAKRKVVISLYSTVLLEAVMSGCLAVQFVGAEWYKPIFRRSAIIFSEKNKLENYLKDKKNQSLVVDVDSVDMIVGQPNYELFLNSLRN